MRKYIVTDGKLYLKFNPLAEKIKDWLYLGLGRNEAAAVGFEIASKWIEKNASLKAIDSEAWLDKLKKEKEIITRNQKKMNDSIDLLNKLQSLCKASITIEINPHRDVYELITEWLRGRDGDEEEIEKTTLKKMIETDTLIRIQFYETPVGFYVVYGHDLKQTLKECLMIIQDDH